MITTAWACFQTGGMVGERSLEALPWLLLGTEGRRRCAAPYFGLPDPEELQTSV